MSGPVTAGLLALDIAWAREWARANGNPEYTDAELLEAMHKARYDLLDELPVSVRAESAAWLIDRGLADKHGAGVVMPLQIVNHGSRPTN